MFSKKFQAGMLVKQIDNESGKTKVIVARRHQVEVEINGES